MFNLIAKVFERMRKFSCTSNNVDKVYDPSSGVSHSPKAETEIKSSLSLPDGDDEPSVVTDEYLLGKYITASDESREKLREKMSREQLVELIEELKRIRKEMNFRTSCIFQLSIGWNTTNCILIAAGVFACGFFPPLLIILSAVNISIILLSFIVWYRADSQRREIIRVLIETHDRRFPSDSNH